MTRTETLRERLAALRGEIDEALEKRLDGPAGAPPAIVEAVRYAVLGPGKRLRPILLLASGEALGGGRDDLLPAACAVEMIHAFSLVHDDLPALDNDDLRRGRPTLHVKYGEATAILAGDALLNLAFETLTRCSNRIPGERRLEAIREIASAVGLSGMISGQVLDLEFEGKAATAGELESIHRLKTGALITACCAAGGILAGGAPDSIESLRRYGRGLGLAFQITDDILDVEGTAGEIGKSPGKDAKAAKATFPSIWGLAESRRLAAEAIAAAVEALRPMGEAALPLVEIARSVGSRRN